MIQQDLKNQIKEAMLKKDTVRLTVLRSLISAFTNELVAKGKKPQEELPDEDALNVIRRSVKQHKDSIAQFKTGAREDLVKEEEAELAILETLLPKMMDIEEIRKIASAKKTQLNITDKSKQGLFMGQLMKDLKGKADGTDVKKVVDELFS